MHVWNLWGLVPLTRLRTTDLISNRVSNLTHVSYLTRTSACPKVSVAQREFFGALLIAPGGGVAQGVRQGVLHALPRQGQAPVPRGGQGGRPEADESPK